MMRNNEHHRHGHHCPAFGPGCGRDRAFGDRGAWGAPFPEGREGPGPGAWRHFERAACRPDGRDRFPRFHEGPAWRGPDFGRFPCFEGRERRPEYRDGFPGFHEKPAWRGPDFGRFPSFEGRDRLGMGRGFGPHGSGGGPGFGGGPGMPGGFGGGRRGPRGPHRHRGPMPDVTGSEHYAGLDTEEKLAVMLRELGHAGRFLLESRGGQNRILELLDRDGGMTQRALTERIGIQPGSASEILGKLEAAGLITRTPNEADRRTVDLSLTETGRAQLEAGRADRSRRVREAFDCLSDEERASLLALMEKLHAGWREKLQRGPEEERE